MQYGLSQCSSCWMYTAVSVWTTKLTRLSNRKPEAIKYFLRVAWAASYSEFLLWIVGRRVWCSMGRPSASPLPRLDRERRPWTSSLSNGCCERPSVGRCIGGRLTTMSSSESSESRSGPRAKFTRGSASSRLSEATMASVLWDSGFGLYQYGISWMCRDHDIHRLFALVAQSHRLGSNALKTLQLIRRCFIMTGPITNIGTP